MKRPRRFELMAGERNRPSVLCEDGPMDLSLLDVVVLGAGVGAILIGAAGIVAAESRSPARLDTVWTMLTAAGLVVLVVAVVGRVT